MSSIVLMRILESAPERYDAGMRLLTLGAIDRAQQQAAALAVPAPGCRVLEIGCGTGQLTRLLLERNATVEAIDQNPEMLDLARSKLHRFEGHGLTLREATAAEIDRLDEGSYDAVVSSLVFSEMSSSERRFVLRQVARIVRPGGRVVLADEVRPRRLWQKCLHQLARLPMALFTWLVTGTTTRALEDAVEELEQAGLRVIGEERSRLGTIAVVCAERRGEEQRAEVSGG